jgi:hypothetical protein
MVLCVVDCRPNQPGDGDGDSGVTSCRTACNLFSSRFSICGSSAALPGKTTYHLDFLMALHLLRLFSSINKDEIYSSFFS